MSEPMQLVMLDDNEGSLDTLKTMLSAMMKEWQNQVITLDTPKREEFSSEEEYQKAYKDFMLETIDDIKGIKFNIFHNVDQINNNFMELKKDTSEQFQAENKYREQIIKGAKNDIKISVVTTAGLSLIIPGALPYLLIINIPRVGIGLYTVRKNKNRIEINMGVEKRLEQIELPLHLLTCDFREDYHRTEEELDDLKIKVLEGNDVIKDLTNIFDPKRVGLKELTEEEFKQIPFEEEPKELKKEFHKN